MGLQYQLLITDDREAAEYPEGENPNICIKILPSAIDHHKSHIYCPRLYVITLERDFCGHPKRTYNPGTELGPS
jgi:hypothetical protein